MIRLLDRIPELRHDLEEVADPTKVEGMQAYMKDRFVYLGVISPDRKTASSALLKAVRLATEEELFVFAEACFDEPEREFHYVAVDALRRGAKTMSAASLPRVRALVETHSWWDTVDSLASNTVGPMVANHPALGLEMDNWIDEPNIWVARVALIHQLKFKDEADPDRIFGYALKRAADTEFFIRKAIGWSLRQHARVDPDAVLAFVTANDDKLSGLTKREALKHFS